MKRATAYILLILFSAFMASTAMDFTRYLKLLNAGAGTEEVGSFPEEQHEDHKVKKLFEQAALLSLLHVADANEYHELHHFTLSENIYFDVPHSPPDLI